MVVKRLKKEERRAQLLDMARTIVRINGLDALTLGFLAESAGVTKPITYDHFGDREGLLMALYKDFNDEQKKKFHTVLSGDKPSLAVCIQLFSKAYIDWACQTGPEVGPIVASLSGSESLYQFHQDCMKECSEYLRQALSPFLSLEGARGDAVLIAIFGAADALSAAAARGTLLTEAAETILKGTTLGSLKAYTDSTK